MKLQIGFGQNSHFATKNVPFSFKMTSYFKILRWEETLYFLKLSNKIILVLFINATLVRNVINGDNLVKIGHIL